MKYTLAFACSQDGFIAKHSKDNPFEWTSGEDQKHLQTSNVKLTQKGFKKQND